MGSSINGSTRIVGLLGNPVTHSLSPQIHNHAFKALGLPFVYIPLAVSERRSSPGDHMPSARVHALGANVTLPHKQQAALLCDALSPLSTGNRDREYAVLQGRACFTARPPTPKGSCGHLRDMGHDAHGGTSS